VPKFVRKQILNPTVVRLDVSAPLIATQSQTRPVRHAADQ